MKRSIVLVGALVITLLSACAPAAAPTPEAMMTAATPTADAMMAKASPTAEAMMAAATPTADAMMAKASPTVEAMMVGATPTADAMMAKASPTADAMMPASSSMGKIPDLMTGMHFVESSPKHGIALAKTPEQVQITFNGALSETSTVSVLRDGVALKIGKPVIDEKMLSMSVTLPSDAGDGVYLVKYKACWAGGTCDDGQFGFKVDSKMGM
jgi:methionine-rich copper-binding protein CopC